MNAKRIAAKDRRTSREMAAAEYRVTSYRDAFEEGRDLMHWASVMESVSEAILQNIDTLVETTYEP